MLLLTSIPLSEKVPKTTQKEATIINIVAHIFLFPTLCLVQRFLQKSEKEADRRLLLILLHHLFVIFNLPFEFVTRE